jgi:short-subunit dehydrogenase
VNNAGRGITRPVSELTDDDLDAMWRDNVKSALYGMQAVLPHFKARNAGQILNVSSGLARMPFAPARSAYSASKSALNSLSASLRVELKASHPGIQVTVAMPGVVATDFGRNALGGGMDSRAFPGAQRVEDTAKVLLEVIEHPQPEVYGVPSMQADVERYHRDVGAFEAEIVARLAR